MSPRLEPLEPRLVPVVGSLQALARGSGYDGVVRLDHIDDAGGSLSTGSLLATGRHILTAAHVLSDGQAPDSLSTNVVFELLDGGVKRAITLSVPAAYYRVNPAYDGEPTDGNDLAVLVLPDQEQPRGNRQMIAPFGAERYGLFTATNEVGSVFTVVGYGRVGTGDTGARKSTSGMKHLGRNLFESYASTLTAAPFNSIAPTGETALAWDFDNGAAANDAFGVLYGRADLGLGADEANPAQGDSGGPLFVNGLIAGVVSYSDGGISPPDINDQIDRGFGEFGVATRVSAFQDYVGGVTGGAYDLVLDMNYQLAGVDRRAEPLTITARLNGANLELVVSGAANPALDGVYYSAPVADVRSLTLRGSDDHETFRLVGDLGVGVTVVGRGGNDRLVMDTTVANSLGRGVAFQGGAGRDAVLVTADANFVLAPGRVGVVGQGAAALAGVEVARLVGGASANRFHVTGWRGQAFLEGAANRDRLIVTPTTGVAALRRAGPSRGVVRFGYADGEVGTVTYARVEAVALSVGATAPNRAFAALLTTASAGSSDAEFIDTLFRATHGRAASAVEQAAWTRMLQHIGREATARLTLTWQAPRASYFRGVYRTLLTRGYTPRQVRQLLFANRDLDDLRPAARLPE